MKQTLVNALRKGTDVLLGIDSQSIVLVPHARTQGQGGVYNYVPQTPRVAQDFAIESVGSTFSGIAGTGGGSVGTEGASVHQWDYEIVGRYDCAMEIGDTWTSGSTIYRITSIKPSNGYERRGIVVAIGKDPSYGS